MRTLVDHKREIQLYLVSRCSICLKKLVEWRESDQTKAKNRCVASDSNFLREVVVDENISVRLTYAFLMLREM